MPDPELIVVVAPEEKEPGIVIVQPEEAMIDTPRNEVTEKSQETVFTPTVGVLKPEQEAAPLPDLKQEPIVVIPVEKPEIKKVASVVEEPSSYLRESIVRKIKNPPSQLTETDLVVSIPRDVKKIADQPPVEFAMRKKKPTKEIPSKDRESVVSSKPVTVRERVSVAPDNSADKGMHALRDTLPLRKEVFSPNNESTKAKTGKIDIGDRFAGKQKIVPEHIPQIPQQLDIKKTDGSGQKLEVSSQRKIIPMVEFQTKIDELVVKPSRAKELFVQTKEQEKDEGIQVVQKKDKIILSVKDTRLKPEQKTAESSKTISITTTSELRKTFDVVNSITKPVQAEKLRTKLDTKEKKQPISEINIVVSNDILDLVASLTEKPNISSKKQPDITFTTQGTDKRKLTVDQNQVSEIQALLFVSEPNATAMLGEKKTKHDQLANKLQEIIQEATVQIKEKNTEPVLFVSKDVMKFLETQKTTIKKLEKIKSFMKRKDGSTGSPQKREKGAMKEQHVTLFSGEKEIRIEIEMLKKLLLLRRMQKQHDNSVLFSQDEQVPEEVKQDDFSVQSGGVASPFSYLTVLLLLSLINKWLLYNNNVGWEIYNH